MKVKVKKVDMKDVQLARILTKKMQRLLSPQFDYIVDSIARAEFDVSDDSMRLERIVFESLDTEDAIVVDEESVILNMDNNMVALLCEPEGFGDALRLTQEDLYIVDEDIMQYVESQRQFCKTEF